MTMRHSAWRTSMAIGLVVPFLLGARGSTDKPAAEAPAKVEVIGHEAEASRIRSSHSANSGCPVSCIGRRLGTGLGFA